MNINIHIERIVLDGVSIPYYQRPLLQTAVETELARLLVTDGLASGLQASVATPCSSADAIKLTGDSDPTVLGQQIAQAVYGGLNR